MGKQIYKVGGLHCGGCVNSVTAILRAQPGVSNARVDLQSGQAEIDASDTFDAKRAVEAVTQAGFALTPL